MWLTKDGDSKRRQFQVEARNVATARVLGRVKLESVWRHVTALSPQPARLLAWARAGWQGSTFTSTLAIPSMYRRVYLHPASLPTTCSLVLHAHWSVR